MRLELAKRKTLKFIDNLNKSKRGVRIHNAHLQNIKNKTHEKLNQLLHTTQLRRA
jgi:hypothetical protein